MPERRCRHRDGLGVQDCNLYVEEHKACYGKGCFGCGGTGLLCPNPNHGHQHGLRNW